MLISEDSRVLRKHFRITIDPAIMNGQPCIRGTRLTARRILEAAALHHERSELKAESPELEDDDSGQPLNFAPENLDAQTFRWKRDDSTEAGRII
jgi:uncharacterized protein (DUF433 family)